MPIAPAGMTQVHLNDGTTTQANESALTVALLNYAEDHGIQDASNLCVLGFEHGYHGNSIGTLSCSDDRVNLQGVPTFDWPRAPFPKMKYPLVENEFENRAEEDRCLEEIRKIVKTRRNLKKDVAAIIIEPISAFENQMATPYFYKRLRTIASENKIPFVVDETKTGVGSTGKMWGHEHWNLANPADIVTFGGKAGISGFYSTVDFRLDSLNYSFEQNVDMVKLANFGVTWKYIQKKNLLSYVMDTSTFLKIELARVQKDRGYIRNLRGYGTFLGFDVENKEIADNLQKWFFRSGINLLRCGALTFGLRPALIMGPKQGAILRDNMSHYSPNFLH
jgi:4-aminobutyrate aminotransferase/(S)-3-amino-2-methylpropionate transaminase